LGRREDLLPEDRQIIVELKDVMDFDTLKIRITKLRNVSIRQYLEEHALSYFNR
jgi:hypothetical protein